MSRLRNRIRKADYFTDGELLRWPRDKRATYSGLWAMAEDSGCLEDDCFEWKMSLWPSPLDADITIEVLEGWRDELIEAGKIIPYGADGKRYLFLRNFHQHEKPTNPQRPDLPLPPWVIADVSEGRAKDGKKWSRCSISVRTDLMPPRNQLCTESVQTQHVRVSRSPVLSSPVQSSPDQVLNTLSDADAPDGATNDVSDDEFTEWWTTYGKIGSKADAERLYRFWRGKGAERGDLLTAARTYRDNCTRTDCRMQHARTFLAKPPKGSRARWYEWAEGEEHGSMDVGKDDDLAAVLRAGSQTYGGDNGGSNAVRESDHPPGLAGRGEDDRRGLPAQCVEPGD